MGESQSQEQASSQRKKVEQIIRGVIRTRRQEEGFNQNVPGSSWQASSVKQAVAATAEYMTEECGETECEALADDPHPEDVELEAALQHVERALNGLMVFEAAGASLKQSQSVPAGSASALYSTRHQAACEDAATDYFHWLLAGDDWVERVRRDLPPSLSERQMIDLLRCPVRRVLSFDDYAALELNPWTTTGRILSEEKCLAPDEEWLYTEASYRNALKMRAAKTGEAFEDDTSYKDEAPEVVARAITVEVDCPDGTCILHTVERQDPRESIHYQVQAVAWWWKSISIVVDQAAMELIWQWFQGDTSADRDQYPEFPSVSINCEKGSVSAEVEALCETIRENDFYTEKNAALRYVMMGTEAPLIGFQCSRDSPYQRNTQEFLTGRYFMTVPAWALPEEVADYWRQVRPPTARERRLPTGEHLALFAFVMEHTPPGTEPRWAALARLWEKEHGFGLTRDRLYRTFNRVRTALFPPHEHSRTKIPSPKMAGPDGRTPVDFQGVMDALTRSDEMKQKYMTGKE